MPFGRIAALVVVAIGAFWAVQVAPIALTPPSVNLSAVTVRLKGGYEYDAESLVDLDRAASVALTRGVCVPEELEALSLIRLARAKAAFDTQDKEAIGQRLGELSNAVLVGVFCSPYQSVYWTILALGEQLTNGHSKELDRLLELSRRTGPYEGWSLARRLGVLLSLYPDIDQGQIAEVKAEMNAVMFADLHNLLVGYYLVLDDKGKEFMRQIFAEASALDQRVLVSSIRKQMCGDAFCEIDLPLARPRGERPWDG